MNALLLCLSFALPGLAAGQTGGFGQNKPRYENFEFRVHQSPHFEMYSYIQDEAWVQSFLNDSEEWYRAHQRVLNDTIEFRNPMVIYANHPDFQQTNAIGGRISTGTGGVTEAFKNRIILPVAATNQQTHHVLGHEMVHAFQYDMVIRGDSTKLQDLQNLPLWMVEGLAEYLSIGSVDPFTAMWMRDAVLNEDVPTIKQLSGRKYFPYRYGQAFWAFVTGLRGDDIIAPYFRGTAKWGLKRSTELIMGMSLEDLNDLWQQSLTKTYAPYIDGAKKDRTVGKELISKEKGGGKTNIAPAISPNGKYLIYLSERSLFSIDLYLADARTGKTIRKIRTTSTGDHVDELSFIENSGTWSPDSRKFAYTGVSKGDNVLVIADVEKGKSDQTLFLQGVPAFNSPAWSPDGKSIVVAGQVEGRTDLFQVHIATGKVTRLTNDIYSETHPAWSADGTKLFYSTDRLGIRTNSRPHGAYRFNLAVRDLTNGTSTDLPVFPGADNLNPVEGPDGQLYFLSNRDGFRNIYRYNLESGQTEQLTDLITGVSGITHNAPAMSIDRRNNRLVYTYFSQQGYRIHTALTDRLEAREVSADSVDLTPARLPRLNPRVTSLVDRQLNSMKQEAVLTQTDIAEINYSPKFKLDHIAGGVGAGIGTNQVFGTNASGQGGAQAIFSDVLGDNQLFAAVMLNGELSDFGGTVGYLNRKHQIQYGASVGRTPYRSFGSLQARLDTLNFNNDTKIEVGNAPYLIRRLYQDRASVFAQLPFSTVLRVEASLSASRFSQRVDQYNRYFNPVNGRPLNVNGGVQKPERREDLEGEAFNLFTAGVALVGDDTRFGLTSPIAGRRFRLGLDQYMGEYEFSSVTADYRQYIWFGKGALALRAMHQGRYGGNGDELFPQYVGSPWLMRGLQGKKVFDELDQSGYDPAQLFGSKMLVANAEIRLPFAGPKPLALIKSGLLLTDINLFVDAGMAFNDINQFDGPVYTLDRYGEPLINPTTGLPYVAVPGVKPIFTAGVSARVNLFGQIVVEPYLARPLVKEGQWSFGVNFQPGW